MIVFSAAILTSSFQQILIFFFRYSPLPHCRPCTFWVSLNCLGIMSSHLPEAGSETRHINQFGFMRLNGKFAGASGKFPTLKRESLRKRESLFLDTVMCRCQAWQHCCTSHITPSLNTGIMGKWGWSHWISQP